MKRETQKLDAVISDYPQSLSEGSSGSCDVNSTFSLGDRGYIWWYSGFTSDCVQWSVLAELWPNAVPKMITELVACKMSAVAPILSSPKFAFILTFGLDNLTELLQFFSPPFSPYFLPFLWFYFLTRVDYYNYNHQTLNFQEGMDVTRRPSPLFFHHVSV